MIHSLPSRGAGWSELFVVGEPCFSFAYTNEVSASFTLVIRRRRQVDLAHDVQANPSLEEPPGSIRQAFADGHQA